jgi:hypothetical protein
VRRRGQQTILREDGKDWYFNKKLYKLRGLADEEIPAVGFAEAMPGA